MKYQETAQRYAKALLQIASEKGHIDSVVQQMNIVEKQIQQNTEVSEFLTSPVAKTQNQKDLLLKLFEGASLREELQNLLILLVQKRRFFLLGPIKAALQNEVDKLNGMVRGVVRSAKALDAAEQKKFEEVISKFINKKTQLEYVQDDSLIGGVVAQVGSYRFDDSLETQIRLMHEDLLKKESLLNGN